MAEKSGTSPGKSVPAIPREEQFVHLHLHTEYSLLDGGNRVDKLVARVAELGMTAVAVTDHGNIFGAVAFYTECKERGIKPILGCEAYVTPPDKPRTDRTYTGGGEGGYHLVLLCENNAGWQNMLYLASEAYLTGFYYKPRIDREILGKHGEGLIAINGHLGSEIGEHLLAYERSGDEKHWKAAVESAAWHKKTFPGRFYVELQHHIEEQNSINQHLIRLAREQQVPLVCDNDSHFLRAEDHDAHDTLVCISTAKNKSDPNRMKYPKQLYVKSPREMRDLFAQYGEAGKEALDNTVAIAERCNVELPIGKSNAPMVRVRRKDPPVRRPGQAAVGEWDDLPRHDSPAFKGDLTAWYNAVCAQVEVVPFAPPGDEAEKARLLTQAKEECDRALRLLAEAGFVWRYGAGEGHSAFGIGHSKEADSTNAESRMPNAEHAERRARLERELKILADKNISAYFLIVWDFVNWGRQRGIPANARGSGVGTMVGYVLGLSNACPVKFGLLFERFTDPDRSEFPDIDIDLCQDGRGEVINYVRGKYGHVAQIITFGTMKARAAIRDVARVLAVSLPVADRIAKLVPEQLNITLDEAITQEPDLKGLYEGRPSALDKINDKLGPDQHIDADTARNLIDNARTLEGQARHAGVHAAGVIVATRPLHEIVPLYRQSGSEENEIVTQWDGPTCEKMGLLKMDFLGLRTLSVVERAKKLIREGLSEEEIWNAVGRGDEYRKWRSGGVAEWRSEDQDISGLAGVATRDGTGAAGVPRDASNAQSRDVRSDESNAQGGVLNPDEHRGGVRSIHKAGVPSRASTGDGVAVRAYDRLRTGDITGNDRTNGSDVRTTGRGGSIAPGADPIVGNKDRGREKDQDAIGTLPLRHSATSPPGVPHPLDLDRLNCDDQRVFEMFRRGDVTGVFQFESEGMRRLLREMKPDRLEDLIAANALFRPGPMDLIPDYNARKHGKQQIPSLHEIVDRHTAETYGVMVYQEQVMQVVHGLGGIKLRDAYTLIKNISKKKHDKIEKERPKFVEGAQSKGLTRAQAEELFELILKFAGYGFNKSHSTGYAIVAYQTAYLKTFFPNQYMSAFLTYESAANKVGDWIPYLEDCKKCRFLDPQSGKVIKVGVEVLPPDINLSDADFSVVFKDGEPHTAATGHVRFGLKAIKGAGDKAIEAIIAERAGKDGVRAPFASMFDFSERILAHGAGVMNKATVESLVKCGAFDSVHGKASRASMVATIEQAFSAAQKAAADKASGQGALFGFGAPEPAAAGPAETGLVKLQPWIESEALKFEKDVLGFYVSNHPLEAWRAWHSLFSTGSTADARLGQQDQRVVIPAMVQSVRTMVAKSGRSAGQKMASVVAEDASGTIECMLFTDQFARYGHLATVDSVLFVLGRIDLKRGEPQVIVEKLCPIDSVPLLPGRLQVMVDETRLNGGAAGAIGRVGEILRSTAPTSRPAAREGEAPALFPVELAVATEEQTAVLALPATMKAPLTADLARELAGAVGAGMVRVVGGISVEPTQNGRGNWGGGGGGWGKRRDDGE